MSDLFLEERWAMGQVTGETVGQIRELRLLKGRLKGMGQGGQYGQWSVSIQRLHSVLWELQVYFPFGCLGHLYNPLTPDSENSSFTQRIAFLSMFVS